jgi:hypothetical protein
MASDDLTPDQLARWHVPSRKPLRLFQTVEGELGVPPTFWRGRTPEERLEYLEFTRCVVYGEEVVNARMVRCYGWRKRVEDEPDPKNVVYF